jgi:hypothetical protein
MAFRPDTFRGRKRLVASACRNVKHAAARADAGHVQHDFGGWAKPGP